MEPATRVRYFAMNLQHQPLELHLPRGVVILESRQEKEISQADLESAQLRVFQKQRLISVREAAEPAVSAEPIEPAEPGSSPAASQTEKPGGLKSRGTSKREE